MNRNSIFIILILISAVAFIPIVFRTTMTINNDTGSATYEKQNRPLLDSLQPGDVVVCTQYHPALPASQTIVIIGRVLKAHQGGFIDYIVGPIKMHLVNKASIRERFLFFDEFDHCEVRVVTNEIEQHLLIGYALIHGLNPL